MQQSRRQILQAIGALGVSARLGARARAAPTNGEGRISSTGAQVVGNDATTSFYRDALVWDNHSGFDPRPNYDLEHLEEWRRAGVDYLSIDVGYDVIDWQLAVKNLGSYITWLEKRPDRYVLARRVVDILEAKRAGKMAITFDLEGMSALNGEADMVSAYYKLGVRQMLIAYNRNNIAGGGCHALTMG